MTGPSAVSLDRAAEYLHRSYKAIKVLPRIGVHAHLLRQCARASLLLHTDLLARDACAQ